MQEQKFEEGKEEDCGICMEKMKVSRKLRCGHCFHQFCLMQMIINRKTNCPICREDIYHGAERGHPQANPAPHPVGPQQVPQAPPEAPPGNGNFRINQQVIGNIVQNMFMPFNIGGNPHQPSEADIERVREVYPDMQREQIVQEILRSGSVEQAIMTISERI